MKYEINLGIWNGIFCVPNAVADDCLKLARGNDLKVLLYLLRNAGAEFDVKEIAEYLSITEEQVEESASFWKQRGIIDFNESGELVPSKAKMSSNVKKTTNKASSDSVLDSVRKIELDRTPDFTPKEIASTVRGNEKADYLFKHCEMLYGRPLKHNEQRTLMIILEDACLPVEVAMVLIDYCFSVNKATPAYMRAVALDWVDTGIITIDKAEEKAAELKNLDNAIIRFKKMFEVTSAFSKQQKECIDKWVNVFGFSDEMVNEAYQITLNATGKLAFQYMNKILEGWHANGITTVEQLNEQEKKHSEKRTNSSFDANTIEQLVTNKYKKLGGDQ
ncbi:MAG: DnaD domain protein [Oscillospiraceae bacterium]|nr:DnaD domain protein [Oscillospiraceae bacterium]